MKPIYYDDDLHVGLPLMPFLVAPIDDFQDTLIFGPLSISRLHDQFINELYSQLGNLTLNSVAIRCFGFRSKICISLLFPSKLTDKGGRRGLTLSIGIISNNEKIFSNTSIIIRYLKMMINSLNNYFSLSLTQEPDKFLGLLNVKREYTNDYDEVINKLNSAVDSMLITSDMIYEFGKTISKKWSFINVNWKRYKKTPKVIYYQTGYQLEDIIYIFISEILEGVQKLGKTGLQQLIDQTENHQLGLVYIIPFQFFTNEMKEIKINEYKGLKYVCIY